MQRERAMFLWKFGLVAVSRAKAHASLFTSQHMSVHESSQPQPLSQVVSQSAVTSAFVSVECCLCLVNCVFYRLQLFSSVFAFDLI